MNISKAHDRLLTVKKHNNHMMTKMLKLSMEKIHKQGSGCFIKDYGVAYVDVGSNTKDSIAIVTAVSDKYLKKHYGLISDEFQKPLVKHLIKRFMIDVSIETERERFITFLQELQYAHDVAFDQFSKDYDGESSVLKFLLQCEKIKKSML